MDKKRAKKKQTNKNTYNANFFFHSRQQVQTLHHTRISCNPNRKLNSCKQKHNKLFSLKYTRFKNIKIVISIVFFTLLFHKTNQLQCKRKIFTFCTYKYNHCISLIYKYRTTQLSQFKSISHNSPYNTTTTQNKKLF